MITWKRKNFASAVSALTTLTCVACGVAETAQQPPIEQMEQAIRNGVLVDGDDPGGSGNDMVALLAWDLSEIPSNAVIEGVTLTIQVTNASSGAYEMYEVKRPWNEDAATWNDADAGGGWLS